MIDSRKNFLETGYAVQNSNFDVEFNTAILAQFIAAKDIQGVKKTHYFNGRYENIYLQVQQVPSLQAIKSDGIYRARHLLSHKPRKVGSWFNAMGPASNTSLHRHDEDDERLSAVYYVSVPENSGNLILYPKGKQLVHIPCAGQWVFFLPHTEHEVSTNESPELRLSLAFNFS